MFLDFFVLSICVTLYQPIQYHINLHRVCSELSKHPLFEGGSSFSLSSFLSIKFDFSVAFLIIISLISPSISGVSLFLKYTIVDGSNGSFSSLYSVYPQKNCRYAVSCI